MTVFPLPNGPRRLALASVALLAIGCFAPAFASERGSAADQEACTPDVFRLCQSEIPDETRIVACLETKRAELSPACSDVFTPKPKKTKHRKS